MSTNLEIFPDCNLCHHAEFRIYVDDQYVESAGSKAAFATASLLRFRKLNRGKRVTFKATICKVDGCYSKGGSDHA